MLSRLSNSSMLKKVGLSVSAVLLSSPILGVFSSAQASPSWLKQSNTRNDTAIAQYTTPGSTSTSPQNLNDIRFSCQAANGQYTVMYNPQSQPGQYYPWASPSALGGGWSPDRRCNEISRRLEMYRPDGLLELQTGVENGYNTVCVTTQDVPACRIVLTVPPGQNAVAIRDRIFNNLLVADNGQQTTAVTAYQDNGNGILGQIGQALGINLGGRRTPSTSPRAINLRPFLDPADGGTGAQLRSTSTAPAAQPTTGSPRLNPGNFR